MQETDVILFARVQHENLKQLNGLAGHCAAKLETAPGVIESGCVTYLTPGDNPQPDMLLAAIQILKQQFLGGDHNLAELLDEIEGNLYGDPECEEHNSLVAAARTSAKSS